MKPRVIVHALEEIVKSYANGIPVALTSPHQTLVQQILGPTAFMMFVQELVVADGVATIIEAGDLWLEMEKASY